MITTEQKEKLESMLKRALEGDSFYTYKIKPHRFSLYTIEVKSRLFGHIKSDRILWSKGFQLENFDKALKDFEQLIEFYKQIELDLPTLELDKIYSLLMDENHKARHLCKLVGISYQGIYSLRKGTVNFHKMRVKHLFSVQEFLNNNPDFKYKMIELPELFRKKKVFDLNVAKRIIYSNVAREKQKSFGLYTGIADHSLTALFFGKGPTRIENFGLGTLYKTLLYWNVYLEENK